MWPSMRHFVVSLVWAVGLVHSAINLDGSQAVDPVTEHDPSPISDPSTYHPDQHDCPLTCVDYANMHSWTPYLSIDRLRRCQEPMLLQFSVTQALNDPTSSIFIRSCSLGSGSDANLLTVAPMENPKKARYLFQGSLESAPACITTGTAVQDKVELATSSGGTGDGEEAASLMEGMHRFFDARDNCDEKFLFAYHKQMVASIYIGASLGKPTVKSALEALAGRLRTNNPVSNHTVAQLCGSGRLPDRIFGIAIDTTGDLAAVQKTALEWSKGNCAANEDFKTAEALPGVEVLDIAGSPSNSTSGSNVTSNDTWSLRRGVYSHNLIVKRATCRYIQVQAGEGCWALANRCGISTSDFDKYNPKPGLCASGLQKGDYVCCSAGDPYSKPKPPSPKPNKDGTCATHLIQNGDKCSDLATKYGITVDDLERWNKRKTWGWTECKDAMIGYTMCVSDGTAAMPPPQRGAECGPVVAGTPQLKARTLSLADLNPCPLKACCSNWGFCGVFPGHCDIHAPPGGGPGTKSKGYNSTCISNCGQQIKQNTGPPQSFQRIGYYESYNLDRKCLWLKAKNANTDGTYTHMHWGFGDIHPKTWKPIIKDTKQQWDDFKALPNMKRIVSFGGWAYSTEAATYNIIRSAIINHGDTFARNLAQFVQDEGIDGIDIDWEYPGAPDILVNNKPVGQKGDGQAYLNFLTRLKSNLGPDKSVSIAAPASYWYLKAFPIDRIASVIDYIVYMTYDLHGQWDHGNPNSYDSCDSGKCIRSHVNLTETRNSLAMITKAGVPNNKIYVGEASYGRSFRMAQDGCWGPMCEFTGSRSVSKANPGRCTNEGGYLAYAEINEIIKRGESSRTFMDISSSADVMIYKGDYVSYMTPVTKAVRRDLWKSWNFAGTIDWAVDLQFFSQDDMNLPSRPESGEGCVSGQDKTVNTGDLCQFSCELGFCPETLCTCRETGPLQELPPEITGVNVMAWDEFDPDLNRLCKFACKHDYCPEDICTTPETDDEVYYDPDSSENVDVSDLRWQNSQSCHVFKDPEFSQASLSQCKPVCQEKLDLAAGEERTSNYGCMGWFPLGEPIPWEKPPGSPFTVAPGKCVCDNFLINEIADSVIEALPAIGQIGCYMLMSALKIVVDIGSAFVPGGRVLDAGLDMVTTAAQLASYIYPEGEKPEDAFKWWLSPCGGTDLVPDDIKTAFDVLSALPAGVSSFKPPQKLKKGSGKKGDKGNPKDQSKPRKPSPKENPQCKVKQTERLRLAEDAMMAPGAPCQKKTQQCSIKPGQATQRLGRARHTIRMRSCVADKTVTNEWLITSIHYAKNAAPSLVAKHCEADWKQACYHYSSAIRVNPQWSTLPCYPDAASTSHRLNAQAIQSWAAQHTGAGWRDRANREFQSCDRDEYPPAYLLSETDPAYIFAGLDRRGQLMRFLPNTQNVKAGAMWKGACFVGPVKAMSEAEFMAKFRSAPNKQTVKNYKSQDQTLAAVTVNQRPSFTVSSWGHSTNPPQNDGLNDNPCWPSAIAAADPGFVLLTYDPYYKGQAPPYNYRLPYAKGANGS